MITGVLHIVKENALLIIWIQSKGHLNKSITGRHHPEVFDGNGIIFYLKNLNFCLWQINASSVYRRYYLALN